MAIGHGHGQNAGKNEFWRKLRHKSGCCCFGWAVYAPWTFYMGIWTLYNPKLPKWPLIGLPDLAGDRQHGHGRILINDAAKQQNPTSCRGYFFWRPAMDRAPGALSIATFEKKSGSRCAWPWPWSCAGLCAVKSHKTRHARSRLSCWLVKHGIGG